MAKGIHPTHDVSKSADVLNHFWGMQSVLRAQLFMVLTIGVQSYIWMSIRDAPSNTPFDLTETVVNTGILAALLIVHATTIRALYILNCAVCFFYASVILFFNWQTFIHLGAMITSANYRAFRYLVLVILCFELYLLSFAPFALASARLEEVKSPSKRLLLLGAPPALDFLSSVAPRAKYLYLASSLFFGIAASCVLWYIANKSWNLLDFAFGEEYREDWYHLIEAAIVIPLIALGAFFTGRALREKARHSLLVSAAQAQEVDKRPPIVFLRSFQNDQAKLLRTRSTPIRLLMGMDTAPRSIDELLVEEFARFGPTIALGKPGEKVPPFGVWRTYLNDVSDDVWQEEVARYISEAIAVVVVVDGTPGIAWELEHLRSSGHLSKSILLRTPKHSDAEHERLWQKSFEAIGVDPVIPKSSLLAIIPDGQSNATCVTTRQFRSADYVVALRWYFANRFDRLAKS